MINGARNGCPFLERSPTGYQHVRRHPQGPQQVAQTRHLLPARLDCRLHHQKVHIALRPGIPARLRAKQNDGGLRPRSVQTRRRSLN